MTLREKIFKTFIACVRDINIYGGAEEFFKKYPVGGLYYLEDDGPYDENGLEMGTGASYERLKYFKECCPYDLFVCSEFGTPRIKEQIAPISQQSLGANVNLENAYNFGKVIGMRANLYNIDWVLGPSVDLFLSQLMPHLAVSDDAEVVAKLARQIIRGIQDQGVCATAKHFPGVGTTLDNSHFSLGHNILSFDEWTKTYGHIYKEVIGEGVCSVMNTHTTLKCYDDEYTDGYAPIGTFSPKINLQLLKKELGFEGPIVTDALIMGGMATGDDARDAAQAFKCGADLLLWPPMEAADVIEEMILSGEIPMSRLDDALERFDKLIAFREKAKQENKAEPFNIDFINDTVREVNTSGICLLRNKTNLIPVSNETHKNILIVDATDSTDKKSSEMLRSEFESRGFKADVIRKIYDEVSLVCWQKDINKITDGYDLLIFNFNTPFVSQWTDQYMAIWGSHLCKKDKKLIINYGSPFFASRYFPDDPTMIEVNSRPTEFIIKTLVDGIMGKCEFKGKSIIKQ